MSATWRSGPAAGWWVVGSVFVLLMTSAGLGFYGLAVYLDAITAEQGFSTGSVSLATSMFFVIAGVTGRLIAPVIEARDIRLVVAAGGVLAALALVLLGQVSELWALYGTYALFSVGFSLSGIVPGTTLVTRWFRVRRSVALSVASTGLSVGGLTLTQLASWLIDRQGLADAAPWLASVYLALIAVSLVTMWPWPATQAIDAGGSAAAGAPDDPEVGYERAVSSRFFRAITAGFLLAMAAQVGGITQLAKLGTERVDRPTGALAVSAVAVASVVARLVGGVVASRVPMMTMTVTLAGLQGVSLTLLALSQSRATLVLSALLFGATVGNLLMLQPLVVAETFGVRAYPRVFALNQLIVTVGIAGGPFLLGALHDAASYRVSFLAAAAVSLGGAGVLTAAGSVEANRAALLT